MARKPNYGFEKRQKELARKNKKLEKKQRRQGPEEGTEESVPEEKSDDDAARLEGSLKDLM